MVSSQYLTVTINRQPSSIIASEAHTTQLVTMATMYSLASYSESWIEISSQPSSSSVSSAADDLTSTRLRVYYDQYGRRRRRLNRNEPFPPGVPVRALSAAGSSQEEYEESESESDRIMTSSNEALDHITSAEVSPPVPTSTSEETSSNNADEDDDDGNATALGVTTNEHVFTPLPNAFSHPPQSHTARHARSEDTRTSYFPPHRTSPHRRPVHSYPSRNRANHSPYNMVAPTHAANHDAALRASLSTLLSCAAAARGLPKREKGTTQHNLTRPSNQIEPSSLRLVPESVITGEGSPPALPPRPSLRRRASVSSISSKDKGKRKASSSKERHKDIQSKKRRANSPSRDANTTQISPTLMTWVVSAGVVVLFSAISFSAGYTIGKEVGRVETGVVNSKDGIVCGKEVGKGLRKLRWGAGSVSVIRV